MELLDSMEMALEGFLHAGGQYGHPIVRAFPLTHRDLVHGKIDVFDAQAETLHQPQTRPIQQTGHEPRRRLEVLEDPSDFVASQDHREFLGLFGADDVLKPGKILVQHLLI